MSAPVGSGVAVVMPAPRRARELPATVEDVLVALDGSGRPHSVIVVDDGSTDGTAAVGEWLVHRYPGRVEVVHHPCRRGAEAARRSGIAAALTRTPHPRVLLTGAGGRWRTDEVARLLAHADRVGAEVLIGDHRGRARSALDGLIARLHQRPGATEPYEFVDRAVLEGADLSGDRTPVGPAVVARALAGGHRVERRPVGGPDPEPTARPRRGPGRSWRAGPDGHALQRLDPVRACVTGGAAIASVLAFLHVLAAGTVLAYPDAAAHLLIARRVVDSPTPGPTQLGAVWLPLPHVLALPGIGIDALYVSGVAGALVSMAAYVLTCRYLYGLVDEITGRREAGVVAALVFALCPNVLYLQSTPMSELPFLCGLAGVTYHLTRWSRTGRHAHLALAAGLTLLATMTRYEAWVFAVAAAGVVVVTAWRRTVGDGVVSRLRHAEAHAVYFGVIAFAAAVAWVGWNAVIFGNATYFYDGPLATVPLLREDVAAGNWPMTLRTYWYAVADNIGIPLTLAGGVGLVVYLIRTRLRGPSLAALTPIVLLPFFLWLLYSGSRPLRVLEISGARYNVRFGLIAILPVAILVGYLVAQVGALVRDRRGWAVGSVAAVLVAVAAVLAGQGGTATLGEAVVFRTVGPETANARVAAWLRTAYTGGRVLMDTPGNETVVVDGRLPTRDVVYDGSYRLWERALAAPAAERIEWIYMRGNTGEGGSVGGAADNPDRVWASLEGTAELAGYQLVYDADDRRVYHRIGPS